MKTVNFTELRKNLRSYLDVVINDADTVVISRENGTAAVIISMDEYNAIKETEYIMQSPATMEAIRRAADELDRGETVRQEDGETVEDFLARI
ncbi:MAG: type II toxin-antitoxin system prevent-host-death family antitoxin [Bacteroidetes bacterium]|uniref:Antitoxin n=1 Tax=Candidatus Cryptobacteroides excrementavium TaxID=2840759 RepID=A0A9D9NRD3_9BACT|nr:type II toxin-antitoxin system prevent-host-death family antitoxin [Candidatus Cryptobacteroides excrementavium]